MRYWLHCRARFNYMRNVFTREGLLRFAVHLFFYNPTKWQTSVAVYANDRCYINTTLNVTISRDLQPPRIY